MYVAPLPLLPIKPPTRSPPARISVVSTYELETVMLDALLFPTSPPTYKPASILLPLK